MKIFVTGGAGFIGSHFIRRWLRDNPQDFVVNVDALTYAGSSERLSDLKKSAHHRLHQADICDAAALKPLLEGCQAVVHFAAETHVDRSITNAAPFLRTNVEGTYNLLQIAQQAGISRFFHISTDEVYGPVLSGSVDEKARFAPRSPYAASKASGDLLAQAFWETHSLPVVIARPTNVYGPGQLPEKFIPLMIANILQKRAIPIYGDGLQRRGWLFVEDLCEALSLIFKQGKSGEAYNIGSGHEQANLDTARAVMKLLEAPESLLSFVPDRPGHDRRYCMNDDKLKALGWKPATSFEQGLAATVSWYQANGAWWQPLVQQLREDPYHWLNRAAGASTPQPTRSR